MTLGTSLLCGQNKVHVIYLVHMRYMQCMYRYMSAVARYIHAVEYGYIV